LAEKTYRTRPQRFLIVGPKVLRRLVTAPDEVKMTFFQLMQELEVGPYPDQHLNVAEARGTDRNHLYVAWKDRVNVMYFVMQDQPVISLVGVHWRTDPNGGNGERRPDADPEAELEPIWTYGLAA
jgi:hypothetical protein